METVFRKEDFKLCYLPLPSGYPYSQTHSGVAYSEEGIGKQHWFLVSSPYPNPKRSFLERGLRYFARKVLGVKIKPSDWYENPMLYYSSGVSVPPSQFDPFPSNPLMHPPKDEYGLGAFNSDPDIFIEGNTIYVLNRPTWRKPNNNGSVSYFSSLYLIKLEYKGNKLIPLSPYRLFDYERANGSPSLIHYHDKYYVFSLLSNSYNTGEPCECVEVRSCNKVDGQYDTIMTIPVETKEYQPWHFSVFAFKGKLYSIVACTKGKEKQRCYQMLGEFTDDLTKFHVYQMPLTDMKSYRGDAVVLPNGKFVLYTSIIEPFPGSHSVDGRDILVTEADFSNILKIIRGYDEKYIGM